jgi:choline-sulfatase
MQPQLFNLAEDPEELCDLGANPKHEGIRRQLETELRSICDPEAVDAMAKTDQMTIVNANGGIEAVVAKGGFGATPPPGVNAEFVNQK